MNAGNISTGAMITAIALAGCVSIDSIDVSHDPLTNHVHVETVIDTAASRVFDVEATATLEFKPVETFPERTATITLSPRGVTVRGEQLFSGEILSPYPATSCLSQVDVSVSVRGRSGTGSLQEFAATTRVFRDDGLLDIKICPDCPHPFVSSGNTQPVRVAVRCPREQDTQIVIKGFDEPLLGLDFDPDEQALLIDSGDESADGATTISYLLSMATSPLPVKLMAISEIGTERICAADTICVIPPEIDQPEPGSRQYMRCESARDVDARRSDDCGLLSGLSEDSE